MNTHLKTLILAGTTAAAFAFTGCANDSPLAPEAPSRGAPLIQTTKGPVTLLEVDPARAQSEAPALAAQPRLLFKYTDSSQYKVERFVEHDHDAKLEVGDSDVGQSKVEIKKYALSRDYTVCFDWAGDDATYSGTLTALEQPGQDIPLAIPAKVELTWELPNLMDVDIPTIGLYAFDRASGTWQRQDADLDISSRVVKGTLPRLGRFALLHLQNGQPVPLRKVQDLGCYDREFIKAGDSEKLETQAPGLDKSFVDIKGDDLPVGLTATFEWGAQPTFEGLLNSVEYGTDVVFTRPVKVRLHYNTAKLLEVDEATIRLFVHDAGLDEWLEMPCTVDPSKRKVEGTITRFGRIALFYVEDGLLYDLEKLGENEFYASKLVKRAKGGTITVGTKLTGKTKIKFKKEDLPYDADIRFTWAASSTLEGALSNVRFGPHGIQFNNPVEVELSYKMAKLDGIDEGNLTVYYLNEETGIWEHIGGQVDAGKKKIRVWLKHFSRYAIGFE